MQLAGCADRRQALRVLGMKGQPMMGNRVTRWALNGAVAAWVLVSAAGCTYLRHRGQDAMDVIDLGVSVSSKPGFALFYDFVPVVPIGYGKVDGHFLGLGGGRFGVMPHYEESYGAVLWGQEAVGFGVYDLDQPKTLNVQHSGLAGLVQGPVPGPDYMISCPHYIHLGWIGVVASPRYLQALDFILGWTTLDIAYDDGLTPGAWGAKSLFGSAPESGTPAP